MTSIAQQPESITAEDAAARMASSLERGGRLERSVLLFAVYRAEVTRAYAESLLVARLEAAGMHINRVYFPHGGDADWPAQFVDSQPPANEVFFLYNLQREFPALLDQLNYRRELLTISRVCAVFWVTEAELAQIAEYAPDFFRFRTEVLELLAVLPMEQRSAIARQAIYRDDEINLSANKMEREAHIALRERLLTDLGDDLDTATVRSGLLRRLGNAYSDLGDYQRAIEYHRQGLTLDQSVNDQQSRSVDFDNLGSAYADRGDTAHAIKYYEQALNIARMNSDKGTERAVLSHLGNVYAESGHLHRAILCQKQALEVARAVGERHGESNALWGLGYAHQLLNQPQQAIDYYNQALAIRRAIGDQRRESSALRSLGDAYVDLGNPEEAIKFYEQALALARNLGDLRGESSTLSDLGNIYSALGESEVALDYYQKALKSAHISGDQRSEANSSWNLGLELVEQGNLPKGLPLLEASVEYERVIGHPDAKKASAFVEKIRQRLHAQ